jgi:hypothetical protein
MSDVAHPPHYEKFKIQPIDYMRAILTKEEFSGYCRGNVLKYVSRYKEKGGIEDLKKAQLYLQWLIETEAQVLLDGCSVTEEAKK